MLRKDPDSCFLGLLHFSELAPLKKLVFKMLILTIFTYVYLCRYVHVRATTDGGQKTVSALLEMGLQEVVSCPARVLGIELRPLQNPYLLHTTEPAPSGFRIHFIAIRSIP